MSDIQTAFPADSKTVVLHITDADNKESEFQVVVKRFKTGDIPKVLKALGPLNEGLKGLAAKDSNFDPTHLFLEKPDECLNFVAAVCKVSRSTLDQSEIDDAMDLFVTVLEVNLHFFVTKVLPTFVGALRRLRDAWIARYGVLPESVAGAMQSISSSPPGTEATTT